MIILALDAVDPKLVQKLQCKNLMQIQHGQTDISEFNLERTIVLWASFLTGKNMEKTIPLEEQWQFQLPKDQTFFNFFIPHKAIDVPAFTFKQSHEEERRLLKNYFEDKNTIEEYDAVVWKNYEENKKEFLESLGKFEIIMLYTNLADAIGHLSFGITEKMEEVYNELENLAKEVRNTEEFTLIISDHGMKPLGRYGDHTKNGFYSTNRKLNPQPVKITDFYNIIKECQK